MSKPVILLDAGELVALPGANDGDVLTWNGTTNAWQSSPGGGVGTVTSVALDTASTGLTVSGGTTQTITGAGTFTLGGTLGAGYGGTGLGAPAVGDAGKVLTATAGGGYELTTNGAGTVTSITAGDGLSGGTITTSGTISMPNVGTAGAYGSASSVPVITTDAQGRVTGVVPTSIAIPQSAVTDLVSDLAGKVPTSRQVIAGTGLSGGGALSSDVTLSLPSVGTQGTYGSASSVAVVTTDQQGRVSNAVTTAIAITQSQVADLVTDLGNKADKSVTATAGTGLTGGGTLGANFSFALDTVGTAASNQGSASKTVTISTDAYGRVTSLSEQSIGSLAASVITSGQLGLANGGTGIDASGVTGGQLLIGGTGALALQSVSQDGSLASTGALTVTGLQTNPVAAGSLGLPDAGKALVWSGSAWQATNIQGGGGGGGLTFYCNYAASSPYPFATQFDEHAGWDTGAITVDNTTTGTALGTFLTASGTPAVEVIPAGIWEINFYAESSAPANGVAVRAKVATLAGATQTVLATSDWVYISDPGVVTAYTASVYVPLTDTSLTDRIEVIFEGRRFGATAYSVTLHFGTDSIAHVHTTINAPGGTGLLKVVDGYLQSPASLLVNADVDAAAAISVSKLAAGTDTYVLTTVSGVPTWSTPPSTGVTSLTGTADQVLVGGTSGTPQTGALTLTLPQSIGTGSSPSFAGLTLSGLTNGIVKASSGVLSGGNSVALGSEVSGTLPILNGGTGLAASGASGNLLVSDGSAWASVAMSGDATIASTGALTLKNTGTAGTYGSASAVPVFVTDAQGRVTSVTNTNIGIDASAITSGTLGVARGGTGVSSIASGQILYASGTNTLAAGTLSNLAWNSIAPSTTISLKPAAVSSGSARNAELRAGNHTGAGGAGATALVYGGDGGSGANGGGVFIDGGTPGSGGVGGRVGIGTGSPRTSEVTIGRSGITTTVNGTLALANALAVGSGGTGVSSIASGEILYASGANTLAAGTLSNLNWSAVAPTTNVVLQPAAVGSGSGYLTTVKGGDTAGASVGDTGGQLTLVGGTSGRTGGDVVLCGGSGTVANGALFLGASTTSSITIGATGIATTIYGFTALENALSVANGGTGATTLTGYVKGSGTSAFTASATVPTSDLSGTVSLTTQVSGTLPIANGGTGASLTAAAGAVAYSTASALGLTAVGTSGQFLRSAGTGAPTWAGVPYDFSGRFLGTPATSTVLAEFVVDRTVVLGTTLGTAGSVNGWFFSCVTRPTTNNTDLLVKVNGSTTIATLRFTSASALSNGRYAATLVGSITATTLNPGDFLTVETSTTVDSAFATPIFSVLGTAT